MWCVYPNAERPNNAHAMSCSGPKAFKPGDIVKVYLAELHVYENSGITVEPEADELIFIGHGMVTNYSYVTEFGDFGENMVHGVLLFGKTNQYEFFDYELQHIDILDICEDETNFLDSFMDDNFP